MEKYYYYDGKTAQAKKVNIALMAQGITINTEEGFRIGYWPFADVEVVSDDLGTNCLRLSHSGVRGARLVITGGVVGRVRNALEQAHRGRKGFKAQHLLLAIPLLAAIVITGYTLYGPPVAEAFLPYIPISVDQKIGEIAESQIVDDITLCGDEAAEKALAKITNRLLENVDSPFTFQVDIALDDTVNAFALPGGHIVIYGGLIDKAETPEEVAGVLAHEMAHVIKRHGVASLAKQLGLQALVFSATGDTNSVINFGHTLLSMSMSRSQEAEADAIGSEILAKSGVSVKGLQAFFARIAKEQDGYAVFNLLATHPHGDDRAQSLKDPEGFKSRPLLTKAEWAALKGYCESYDLEEADDA